MKKLTLRDLKKMKKESIPITASTAFDYAAIHVAEEAEIDILIPDDYVMATAVFGGSSSIPIRMEEVLFYLKSLVQTVKRAFIVAPLPFEAYRLSNEETIRNAARLMKVGADSVVIQGAGVMIERVRAMTEVGVLCLGHLGYMPHYAKSLGPERVVGDSAEEAAEIYRTALELEKAGAWGVLLQDVPKELVEKIKEDTDLITIGAGITAECDGYRVIGHDILGWVMPEKPLMSVQYANFFERAVAALNTHCAEVQKFEFPTEKHTFVIPDEEYDLFVKEIEKGDASNGR